MGEVLFTPSFSRFLTSLAPRKHLRTRVQEQKLSILQRLDGHAGRTGNCRRAGGSRCSAAHPHAWLFPFPGIRVGRSSNDVPAPALERQPHTTRTVCRKYEEPIPYVELRCTKTLKDFLKE